MISRTLLGIILLVALIISGFLFTQNPPLLKPDLTYVIGDEIKTLDPAKLLWNEDIRIAWVPCAFEIPLVIRQWAKAGVSSTLIALCGIIQGETPHAGLIANQVTDSLARIMLEFDIPVIDGVVATENHEQAEVRCKTGEQSRGAYAARAAIEMATLLERI